MPMPLVVLSAPVVVAIVPPVPAEPLPVTLKVPVLPVLLMKMPLLPPVELTFRNVTLDAPIVELLMLTAGPGLTAVVPPTLFVPVTVRPTPLTRNVSAVPLSVMPPLNVAVPPLPPTVMPLMLIVLFAALCDIVPPYETDGLPLVTRNVAAPAWPVNDPPVTVIAPPPVTLIRLAPGAFVPRPAEVSVASAEALRVMALPVPSSESAVLPTLIELVP